MLCLPPPNLSNLFPVSRKYLLQKKKKRRGRERDKALEDVPIEFWRGDKVEKGSCMKNAG